MRIITLIGCGIVLASCSRVTDPSSLPPGLPNGAPAIGASRSDSLGRQTAPDTSEFTHLFSFSGFNGAYPQADLLNVKGLLYGTFTVGAGGVFTITPSGYERVLYTFKGYSDGDGDNPQAVLLNVKGLLYGTTESGGASDRGSVFTITRSGYERVLYSFTGQSDGANPLAGLIAVSR